MQQRFLLQILLLAQHVSGITIPIIRSSRVLHSGCCLWYFVLWFFKWLVWCGAEGYVSGLQDAMHHANRMHNPMPIIRSSRVLYSGCCLWYFVLWFFKWLVWCGAEGYVSGLQDAAASCKPDT